MLTGSSHKINGGLNVVALTKCDQTFIFSFDNDPHSLRALIAQLSRYAADPQLDFQWIDATRVIWEARRLLASA